MKLPPGIWVNKAWRQMTLPKEQARLRAKATKKVGYAMSCLDHAFRHLLYNSIRRAEKRIQMSRSAIQEAQHAIKEWKRIR